MLEPIVKRNQQIFYEANSRLPSGEGIDGIFIYNMEPGDANFFLVTGAVAAGHFKYSSAMVHPDGNARLLIAQLERLGAEKAGLEYMITDQGTEKDIPRFVSGCKRLGINATSLPEKIASLLRMNGYDLVDVSDELTSARTTKTEEELASMRKACNIVCRVCLDIPKYIRPGVKEIELAAQMEYQMRVLGSSGTAFDTIVASGPNPADPHFVTGDREIREGDFILLDFGAVVNGMHSDITRNFVLGPASDLQRELYSTILGIQEEALRNLRVGIDGYGLWENASNRVEGFFLDRSMKGEMGHGLGHGIGYFTHDGPRISKVHYTVPNGLIVTVEPGGYSEGFGGVRIEDDVLVTDGGLEILTSKAPKDSLIEIPITKSELPHFSEIGG